MSNLNKNWNTYRTRFLVKARQLTEPFSFVDVLGRQHTGKPGDYLVEFSEAMLRIVPRAIFEDVYVLMNVPSGPMSSPPGRVMPMAATDRRSLPRRTMGALGA